MTLWHDADFWRKVVRYFEQYKKQESFQRIYMLADFQNSHSSFYFSHNFIRNSYHQNKSCHSLRLKIKIDDALPTVKQRQWHICIPFEPEIPSSSTLFTHFKNNKALNFINTFFFIKINYFCCCCVLLSFSFSF